MLRSSPRSCCSSARSPTSPTEAGSTTAASAERSACGRRSRSRSPSPASGWSIEPRAPRAAPLLLISGFIGWAAGVGFNVDAILSAEFGREAVDTATEDHPFTLLAYVPWGWFAPLSVTATGVVLWRTRAFSRPSAALLVVAGVLFIASRPARIEPLAVIADCVAIVALVPIGWKLLASRPIPVSSATAAAPLGNDRPAAAPEVLA